MSQHNYKLYSRWYLTPDRLHVFHPTTSPLCWRYNSEVGSLLHIWWECAHIKPFWETIHKTIAHITTYTLEFSPAQYLLHHTIIPQSNYRKSLTLHLINAAKQCAPQHWKNTNPPTLSEWLKRVEKIAEMEDLIHQAKEMPTKFGNTWACWIHFRDSQEYKSMMLDSQPRLPS